MAGGEGGWWTFTVFVLICVVFGLAAHDFFSRANWVATSEYAVEYLLLAVGQTFVITKLRITPFIVTLGMLGMATGGTYLLDDGNQVSNLPAQIGTLGQTIWLGGWLPAIVVVAAVFPLGPGCCCPGPGSGCTPT